MEDYYDFSNAVKNPYASRLKAKDATVTITIENIPADEIENVLKTDYSDLFK